MISFENPSLLWGLTGLAVAVAIHLLSRKPAKITYAGSIRHLEGSASRQFKSLRLNEWLLLALRMLALTIFCFIISDPLLLTNPKNQRWVLVERGLSRNKAISKTIDSLTTHGYALRSLEEGFPNLVDNRLDKSMPSYWALSESLRDQPVNEAIIFYRQRAEGFRGERSAVPAWQHWIPVTSDSAISYPINATTLGDSVQVRMGTTINRRTSFETITLPLSGFQASQFSNYPSPFTIRDKHLLHAKDSILLSLQDTIRISIHASPGFERDVEILSATFQALEKTSHVKFMVSQNDERATGDWIVWLSTEPFIKSQNKFSIVFDEKQELPLLHRATSNQWILTHHLAAADALEQNFPITVGEIMLPEHRYEATISQKDQRVAQEDVGKKISEAGYNQNSTLKKRSIVVELMLILLFVLVAERLLAWKRDQ